MRQIWIPRTGPPEVLEVREAPDPLPARGQLRIRVEAVGVNFADIMGRLGVYPDLPKLPAVPVYEVAGRVDTTFRVFSGCGQPGRPDNDQNSMAGTHRGGDDLNIVIARAD